MVICWHRGRATRPVLYVLAFLLALAELARRAQWNVLRLEWEQHHNSGEWRAVKEVHLELSESLLTHPSAVLSSTYAALRQRWAAAAAPRPPPTRAAACPGGG